MEGSIRVDIALSDTSAQSWVAALESLRRRPQWTGGVDVPVLPRL